MTKKERTRSHRTLALAAVIAVVFGATAVQASDTTSPDDYLDTRSLDGSGNNLEDPTLGQAGQQYVRVATASYADGVGEMISIPDPRFISNRVFNDSNQNLFSEGGITHWGFVWGQFLDHTIGLRESGDEELVFPFNTADPLEEFTNDTGVMSLIRSAVAGGTGVEEAREQVNTVSAYIDAFGVYGGTDERLDWLRVGPVDGDPTNNEAMLLTTADEYLPTTSTRAEASPAMDLIGVQRFAGDHQIVAGDTRANENIGLTAVHTLFVREHNRIVEALPDDLSEEVKFEIARRVVAATQQYITYAEFLPSFGVELPAYDGYDPSVDPSISNEFATVGYRAHSMVHGEFEMEGSVDDYSSETLAELEDVGVEIAISGDDIEFAIPLNVAFGRPELLPKLGLGTVLSGLASEAQYANDEQIDNQLRSVLFGIPRPDAQDPTACLDGPDIANCFSVVNDLGALDVLRALDHGIPSYNDLREAYGLDRVTSFTEITGEPTQSFPSDRQIDRDDPINDPDILDIIRVVDADGNTVSSDAADAVESVQRSTLAARLAAIFGSVDDLDAFTGMVSEQHVSGTEFGELQLAMWTRQFEALRDGDRFFYLNDPVLEQIDDEFGIDFRQGLAEVIANNTGVTDGELADNPFLVAGVDEAQQQDDPTDEPSGDQADTDGAPGPGIVDPEDGAGPGDGSRHRGRRGGGPANNSEDRPRRGGGRMGGG